LRRGVCKNERAGGQEGRCTSKDAGAEGPYRRGTLVQEGNSIYVKRNPLYQDAQSRGDRTKNRSEDEEGEEAEEQYDDRKWKGGAKSTLRQSIRVLPLGKALTGEWD